MECEKNYKKKTQVLTISCDSLCVVNASNSNIYYQTSSCDYLMLFHWEVCVNYIIIYTIYIRCIKTLLLCIIFGDLKVSTCLRL